MYRLFPFSSPSPPSFISPEPPPPPAKRHVFQRTHLWRTHPPQRDPPYARDTVLSLLCTFLYSLVFRCLICQDHSDREPTYSAPGPVKERLLGLLVRWLAPPRTPGREHLQSPHLGPLDFFFTYCTVSLPPAPHDRNPLSTKGPQTKVCLPSQDLFQPPKHHKGRPLGFATPPQGPQGPRCSHLGS